MERAAIEPTDSDMIGPKDIPRLLRMLAASRDAIEGLRATLVYHQNYSQWLVGYATATLGFVVAILDSAANVEALYGTGQMVVKADIVVLGLSILAGFLYSRRTGVILSDLQPAIDANAENFDIKLAQAEGRLLEIDPMRLTRLQLDSERLNAERRANIIAARRLFDAQWILFLIAIGIIAAVVLGQ